MVKPLAAVLVAASLLAACSHPSQTTYKGSEAGRIQNTKQATVVSVREVEIQGGENTGLGAAAGAASAGTVANAATKGDKSLPATVIAALAGAGVGYLIEDESRSRQGFEYVLRMPDGRLVTLLQNKKANEQPIPSGEEVLIQQGRDFTRIVALPEGTKPAEIQTQGPDNNGLDQGRGVAPVSRETRDGGTAGDGAAKSSQEANAGAGRDADTGDTSTETSAGTSGESQKTQAPDYPDAGWSDPNRAAPN